MKHLAILLGLWTLDSGLWTSFGADWPQFRGPQGTGVAAEAKHPDQWSPDQHLAWKTKIPGVGWSQPVVWGDKLFVTTAASDKEKGR